MKATRCGFTLLELLVTISIVAVIAVALVPRLGSEDRLRVMAAAELLHSDIEMAQTMCVSNPSDPVVVRFDAGGTRYWLARTDDPGVPLIRDDTGLPYDITLGLERASSAENVTITLTNLTDGTLRFDDVGAAVSQGIGDPVVRVESGGRWIDLAVSSETGTVTDAADFEAK